MPECIDVDAGRKCVAREPPHALFPVFDIAEIRITRLYRDRSETLHAAEIVDAVHQAGSKRS
jgi:hypothetical protein